jgi:serine/threonine protein kinase/tetratricopeptide (TPR) repeat protein
VTPERWQQIRAIFEQVELLEERERPNLLDRLCIGDDELRKEVESLLEAAAKAGTHFMDTPAADLVHGPPQQVSSSNRIGRRIGAYGIVAEIGQGGMGEVYRGARIDGQFDQQVAIKLVRVGMGSTFVVRRFLHERQILASLNHPNIARLIDGGTTDDDVPYLVMELIDGERIDVYCQSKELSVSERLQLFLEVCEAVEYAHRRLVVHRDIKPSNILITTDAKPRLLDFGIAKMLDPEAEDEATLARPMTPEYASPEQIRGESITTATDVYSLGVVLYQLLTGSSPYGASAKTAHEWSRTITEVQPQRPSSKVVSTARLDEKDLEPSKRIPPMVSARESTPAKLHRRLKGDIDSILLKALRKEPEQRYGSVHQFADDITRHLNGLPVTARKGSWIYSARKFVLRHRTGMAATAVVMLALAVGVVATERQAHIAQIQRAKAQKRFDDVRRFSDSLIFDIHDALQAVPGTTAARNLLLDRAVQYLDNVSKDAEGDSELQRELARAYQRLATVQGDSTVSNTGALSAAETSAQKAMSLFEGVAAANPANTADQLNLAILYRQKGMSDIYYPDGRPEIEKAIAITDRLTRTDGNNPRVQIERATELQGLGLSYDISGDRAGSVEFLQKALTLVEAVAQRDPRYHDIRERKAKLIVELGQEYAYMGEIPRARELTAAGATSYEAIVNEGAQPDTIRDLAATRLRLGKLYLMGNDLPSASQNIVQARAVIASLAKADKGNILFRSDVLTFDFEQGEVLILQGKFKEGESYVMRLIADFAKLASEEDSGPGDGVMYTWVGEAQFGMKNYPLALQSFQRAISALESGAQYDDSRTGLVTDYVRVGETQLKLGHSIEAEAAFNKARSKTDLAEAKNHRDIPAIYSAAEVDGGLGELWMMKSLNASNLEERERDRQNGCDAFKSSLQAQGLIPAPLRFSPSEFPVADLATIKDYRESCETITAKPRQ